MDPTVESFTTLFYSVSERFILFLPKLIASLTIFVVGIYLANLFTRILVRTLKNRRTPAELTQFISSYARSAIVILIVVVALQQIDFDLTAFIAGLGILGFTIGFALQDITQNIVSGLILLVQRPFEIGDLVEISGFTGFVTAIDIRSTNVRTLDGHDVLIPNYDVSGKPITNYTQDPQIRISILVSIAYEANVEYIRETTREAILAAPFILDSPKPEILLESFGDSAIMMRVFYWVNVIRTPVREAKDIGMTALVNAYREANIVIPYPIQVEIQKDAA